MLQPVTPLPACVLELLAWVTCSSLVPASWPWMLFSGQTFGVLRVARETVRSSHAEVRLAPLSLRAEPGHRWNLTDRRVA